MGSSRRQPRLGLRPVYLAAAITSCLVFAATSAMAGATPAQKCESSKLKAAAKNGGCRGKSASKSVKKETAPDYSKCEDKFDGAFDKAETKDTGGDCPTSGDAATVAATIEACMDQVVLDLGDAPGAGPSKCTSGKMKTAGKHYDCFLKASSKAVKKGIAVDPGALTKCTDKFNLKFGKAETKADCNAPTGDAAAIKAALEDCALDVAEGLTGGPSFPENPEDYVAEVASYLDTLTIPAVVSGVPECCKDFGPISKDYIESGGTSNNVDNSLAVLADSLGGLAGIDFNTLLADAIADGSLAILFDHRDLDGGALPDDFTLVQLFGAFDNGTTPVDGAAGNGEFLIEQGSFLPGTGTPISFSSATMADPPMTAGPFSLELEIPFGFVTLDLTVSEAEVGGDPGPITAAGVPYTDGEISGYILLADVYGAINAILNSPQCDCLGLGGTDVYTEGPPGVWTGSCVTNANTLCPDPLDGTPDADEDICVILSDNDLFADPPQVCGLLPTALAGVTDIDTNADPTYYEGMSLGLGYTGQNAQINGVAP